MIEFIKNSLGVWFVQTLWAAVLLAPVAAKAQGVIDVNSNAPFITSDSIYDGRGATMNGNGYSGIFVLSGNVSISNVTLTNFVATGGAGSGGGAGLGGALFINSGASVTLTNVSFGDNAAVGGNGGVGTTGGSLNGRFSTGVIGSTGANGSNADSGSAYVNGGNGGNGYNGATGGNAANGVGGTGGTGGTGGNGSAGSAITADTVKTALDVTYDGLTSGEDGTVAGVYTSIAATMTEQAAAATASIFAAELAPGFAALAVEYGTLATETAGATMTKDLAKAVFDGAYLTAITVTNLQVGVAGNGGSGGNGGSAGNSSFGSGGGTGGAGGNGANAYSNSKAIGGSGGAGGTGGTGGFGAGGGLGGNGGNAGSDGSSATNAADNGSGGSGGTGGFGAGTGSTGDGSATGAGGNGGSGYGGGIFVNADGILNINESATFSQGHVLGGGSENGGDSGKSAGTDLFMMKGSTVNLNAGSGVIIFNGTIADDSKASIEASSIADGQGASININSGLVIFNGANTYSGQTHINGGVLQAWDGVGLYTNSNLNFSGGVFQTNGIFDRYVGTSPWKVQWTGDGGFSAVDGELTVRLNGGIELKWGANSFVPTDHALLFGSSSATDCVIFKNNINLNGGNRAVLVAANAGNTDNAILTGILSNGALTVNDATHNGILVLTNVSTYGGGTTINNGTLALKGEARLNSDGAVVADGIFDISQANNQTIGDLSGAGLVKLGANKLTLGIGDSLFSGSITDGGIGGGTKGSIVKRGSGTQTLTGVNTYTGGTTIDAGGGIALKDTGSLYQDGAVEVNGTFDISQSGNQMIGDLSGSGTVNLGSKGLAVNIGDSTFSGTISDGGIAGGVKGWLFKRGSGTLTLTGINTYTGGTIIDAGGRIALKDNGILYRDGAVLVNGAFDISQSGNQMIGDLSGSGTVYLGANKLTLNIGDSLFSGSINDGGIAGGIKGSLVKRGSGTLTLTGINTYTGGTTIDLGGRIALKDNGILYRDGAVAVNGVFDISQGGNQMIGDLSGSGTVNLGSKGLAVNIGDSTFSGTINNGGIAGGVGGWLFKRDSGTLTLTGVNTYTGGTFIDAGGRIALKDAGILYRDGAVVADGTFDISQGGNQMIGDLSGSGTVHLGANKLTLNIGDSTFSGSIKDGGIADVRGGSVVKRGLGTLTLTGVNTYTGGTTIDLGGRIAMKDNGILYRDGAVHVNGVFDISQGISQTIGDLSGSGLVALGSRQLTVNIGDSTFSGSILDGGLGDGIGGSLVKRDTGTLTLTGLNFYTGGTTIDAGGRIVLKDNGALSPGGAVIVNGIFDVSQGHNQTIGDLGGSGDVFLGGNQLIFGTSNNTTFSGKIEQGGSGAILVKQGSGTFSFSGTTSVEVINVRAGTFALEAVARALGAPQQNLPTTAVINISAGAGLQVNNDNTISVLNTNGTISGVSTLTATQYNLNDGTVVNGKLGLGTVNANGGVLINAKVAAETFNIQSGSVTLTAPDVLAHKATVDIAGGAYMVLNGGDQTILNLTGSGQVIEENNHVLHVTNGGSYSGVAASVGSLLKSGGGTLTLSGINIYNKGTTVQDGVLVVNGQLTSTMLVDAGGTLKGSGLITGNVTNNGILAPGNSPGILTVNGNYTENAVLQIEIGGRAGAGVNPNGHDQVAVSGVTILNPRTSVLEIQPYNNFIPVKGDTFKIIHTKDGGIKGSFGNVVSDLGQKIIFSRWDGSVTFTGLAANQNIEAAFSKLNDNQKAMLRDLRIGPNQYDGGNLLTQLLQTSDSSLVFDKASPEAYAGMVDYGIRSVRAYTDSALNMKSSLETGTYSLFGGYAGLSVGANDSVNRANYDLGSNGGIAGIRGTFFERLNVGLFGGVDTGSVNSTFLRSDVTGSVWGLFGEYAINADRTLQAVGTLTTAAYTTDGTRTTNTGKSTFNGVDTSANEASLALQYVWLKGANYTIKPEFKVAYSNASVDGFKEKNQRVSEALQVNGMDANSLITELAINGAWEVVSKLTLKGRIGIFHDFEDASRDVTANLVKESTNFTVQAPGLGQTEVNFTAGASYNFTERFGFGVSYKGGYNPDATFSNTYSCNLGVSF